MSQPYSQVNETGKKTIMLTDMPLPIKYNIIKKYMKI